MKIPAKYYQFNNAKVLLIVSGTERAELLEASNGEVKKISSIAVEKVRYSDKEGAYIGKAGLFRGGSVLDDAQKKEKNYFLELLKTKYAKLKTNNYDYIALAAPKERVPEIVSALGMKKTEQKKSIRVIKEGNFLHYSTKEIIGLFSEALYPLKK